MDVRLRKAICLTTEEGLLMKRLMFAGLVIFGLALFASPFLSTTIAQSSTSTPIPAAEGENSVVLLPDRDGSVGQIVIYTGNGGILINQPSQTFLLLNSFQQPPPPLCARMDETTSVSSLV